MSGERLERRDLGGGARQGFAWQQRGRRVVSGLFFFPRGGSAQVARALSRALAQTRAVATAAIFHTAPAQSALSGAA